VGFYFRGFEPRWGRVTVIFDPDLRVGGKNYFMQNLIDFQVIALKYAFRITLLSFISHEKTVGLRVFPVLAATTAIAKNPAPALIRR
jgi:hypothetical protein